MDRILIETAFEVLLKARALEAQGKHVVHLEIGEPDFETPSHVVAAGKKAIDDGWTHYGPTQGYPEFREAIAAHVSETRGIAAKASQVCVVPGGKPILFFPMMALLEEGDEVIYPNPGFPIYESDLVVLSDEIYSRIYYDAPPMSIASLPGMQEKTIILDGFSKIYAMTGWRLGYGVMPEWLVDAVNKLMVNSNSCTASFTQRAGLAALTGPQDEPQAMVAEFRRRRDAFIDGLNTLPGFRCAKPAGAFYAFPNIEGTGRTSKQLADELLYEAGVASLNGGSFGSFGNGYLRFSYANSLENLMEAVERMRKHLTR